MNNLLKKINLRKEYLLLRKNIDNKKDKSLIIMQKVINEEDFIKSNVIALYKSLDSEVSTNELIEYSLKIGKVVLLPRVVDNQLLFYKITNDELLVKSSFGVLEPVGDDNMISKNDIDLIIVPGVCFDLNKNRLGFGKGYYDRFLNNTNLKTIGICFDEQVLRNNLLPIDNNDVKLDKIITNKRII